MARRLLLIRLLPVSTIPHPWRLSLAYLSAEIWLVILAVKLNEWL